MKPSTPGDVERLLTRLGFLFVRAGKGSHRFYRHVDGRRTTLSFHNAKTIAPGTLRAIIRDIGISVEEFDRLV